MMNVNLDRKDLIRLIRGIEPSYMMIELLVGKEILYYSGGMRESFRWEGINSRNWDDFSEEELFQLYQQCKEVGH